MELYFDLIPSELIELLVYSLNKEDLFNFIQIASTENLVWSRVLEYHFGYLKKRLSVDDYIRYLGVERFKNKLNYIDTIRNYTIEELINLEKLSLDNKQIQEIPKEIGNLTNLQELGLYNNKKISSIPKEIGNLTNLTILDLSDNEISSIPKEIGNLSRLQGLHLNYNQIREVPKEIGNL